MGWKNLNPDRGTLPEGFPDAPVVILVRPQMGENIGMAARAMLNCGISELRIVSPRDGWPNEAARKNASGALLVVDNATLYDNLADAIADCDFVLATTARDRDMVKPVFSPDMASQAIIAEQKQHKKTAILFGAERSGLENDELSLADGLITVPLNPNFSSLNLAQAVLLVCYQWYSKIGAEATGQNELMNVLRVGQSDTANKKEIGSLVNHIIDELDGNKFFANDEVKPVMIQNLTNMFVRMRMTSQESRTFHGIVKSLVGRAWKAKS